MLRKTALLMTLLLSTSLNTEAQGPRRVAMGDWPEMRGPNRDGLSRETGLIDRWALNGENFLWRAPYGGRSAPVVMGNRVYLQNPSGRGVELQERVMALDADTGRMIWEYKFSIFQSDAPPHRIGWASPAIDTETGNIYALSGGAQVIALNKDGKLLWQRSFGEEYAAFTTQGGRTMSPLVDGNLVIVSAAVSNWEAARLGGIALSPSTNGPERSSMSPTPAAVHTTRHTRRPLLQPSMDSGYSLRDLVTAVFTPLNRKQVKRCGASSPQNGPSIRVLS